MASVKVSKRFTVNMGNYESEAIEISIELDVDGPQYKSDISTAIDAATELVDQAAYAELHEAAAISNVKDTFVLTWLNNRKDKTYAGNN